MPRSALQLLHYWWPPVLGWSLALVVARATGRRPDGHGLVALMAGILCAYSLDRAFDRSRRVRHGRLHVVLLVTGALAALACAVAAWRLPATSGIVVPALGAIALLYPALKRLLLTKLVLLPAVWVVAAIALPFPDGTWFAWRTLLLPVALPIFLLIGAGCLLCDLKDEQSDERSGVQSLPAVIGGRATIRIAIAVALVGGGAALAMHEPELAVGSVLLSAVALRPDLVAAEASGPLFVDVMLSVPGLLVAVIGQ